MKLRERADVVLSWVIVIVIIGILAIVLGKAGWR